MCEKKGNHKSTYVYFNYIILFYLLCLKYIKLQQVQTEHSSHKTWIKEKCSCSYNPKKIKFCLNENGKTKCKNFKSN